MEELTREDKVLLGKALIIFATANADEYQEKKEEVNESGEVLQEDLEFLGETLSNAIAASELYTRLESIFGIPLIPDDQKEDFDRCCQLLKREKNRYDDFLQTIVDKLRDEL